MIKRGVINRIVWKTGALLAFAAPAIGTLTVSFMAHAMQENNSASSSSIQVATSSPPPSCPAYEMPPLHLKNLRDALEDNEQVVIVAIGSSSTQGWMSSDIGASYPALLQKELSEALPHAHIAVINRGIGGEDVAEETPRLQSDALDVHPQLVIWQVGANGAMRNISPDVFRKMVMAGVVRMHKASADVVLMDNQRAPRIIATKEGPLLDSTMASIAHKTGAALFQRGQLMDHWQDMGHPYADFIASDGLHHNDLGYRCVAHALAQAILAGLKETGAKQDTTSGLPHHAAHPSARKGPSGDAHGPDGDDDGDDDGS
ncbi:Acyl-CoA thioesterase I [Granulibacter bethesdensis]|uniref:Acyl-CoA thioesterase I n=1 Tax=Granulibacter bethesdensis TaxID=364410 RepID=A0AAN0RFN9_9PROT|nr:Acyl-CoA thioesterase I [Granulibacter bethesdensis]